MQKTQENRQEEILKKFFYPEGDLQQRVLGMHQMSLMDSLAIKASWGKIQKHLEKGELPSEYLYLAGAEIYNRNSYSVNSPYHVVSVMEADGLLKNADKIKKYLGETIIDIGCGNGAKSAGLIKYIKENGGESTIKKYIGLDSSVSMLRATEDNFHKAKIHDIEVLTGRQKFQELKLEDMEGDKAFLFLGGSLGTFDDDKQVDNFLQDVRNNMGKKDTFIATVFTLPKDNDKLEISDQELKKLQKRFMKAERERYDRDNVWEIEKQKDVDIFKREGIGLTTEDIDMDFSLDEDTQCIIDKITFNKDIKMGGYTVIEKGFIINRPSAVLDRDFFQPMVEKRIKNFTESIYNTNQSREFVLNFFKRYLHADMDKLAYKAERNDITHTMEIFVECLDDIDLYPQDKTVHKKKGDKIFIHKSHRFTHDEIENRITKNGFEIKDGFAIGGDLEILKKLVHEEIMKIYILKKK